MNAAMGIFTNILCGLLLSVAGQLPHFEIQYRGDALTEKERDKVERMAQCEIQFFDSFAMPDTLRLTMTVFEASDEARAYVDSIRKGRAIMPLHLGGIYMHYRKEAVVFGLGADKNRNLSTLYHEMCHFFLKSILKCQLPIWLNEGICEYFEHYTIGKKGAKHVMPEYDKGKIRTMFMLGEVNLKTFVGFDRQQFNTRAFQDESASYVLAHALVSLLIEEHPRELIHSILQAFQQDEQACSYELLDKLYPGGFVRLETDFKNKYE